MNKIKYDELERMSIAYEECNFFDALLLLSELKGVDVDECYKYLDDCTKDILKQNAIDNNMIRKKIYKN